MKTRIPKKKSAVVTGVSGFIGSNLAQRLLAEGYQVIGIDNFSTGDRRNAKKLKQDSKFIFIEADICCPEQWTKQVKKFLKTKFDFLFHFASPASPPHYQKLALETIEVNTVGLKNCLQFADKFKARVVFASTSEVYGDPDQHPQQESYWGNVNSFGPRSCYDESKRLGEAIIYSWNQRFKTKHGLIRIFNTYGPGMNPNDGRVIVNLLLQAMKKDPVLTIYGDGKQTRSFCFINDLVDGIFLYAKSNIIEPINFGNQNEFSILELADVIKGIFPSKNIKHSFVPLPIDDPRKRCPDTSKAFELLKWKAKISLEDGLRLYYKALVVQKN